jgi:YidC/Oxa1 family membrane protein insertase
MERNQIIGITLILATLFAWTYFNAPSEVQMAQMKRRQDSLNALKDTLVKPTTPQAALPNQALQPVDSIAKNATYGSFASAAIGTPQDVVLENETLKLTFNTKGGFIKEAILKKHIKTETDSTGKSTNSTVILLNNPKNNFSYSLPVADAAGRIVRTGELIFTPTLKDKTLTLTAKAVNGGTFTQIYTLSDEYTLNYKIQTQGLAALALGQKEISLQWENFLPQLERGKQFESNYSSAYFKQKEEKVDYCNCVQSDTKDKSGIPIEWVSHVNQFFNTSLIADGVDFNGARMQTVMTDIKYSNSSKQIFSDIKIPLANADNGSFAMKLYVGPNEFNRLKTIAPDLEEVIPFGSSIFGTINRWVIRPFFDWLSTFIGSKGVVILALIFLIKMLLYPLMYKTLYSQAKMGALKPEIDKIKGKHKDDMQKQQMETMKLYQEYGVSPLGGCLPMLLQAPIWYALFRFFPASITFRQEPFLWATDLSSYDVMANLGFEIPFFGSHVSLFTLLWAVSTIVYTYYSMQSVDMSANPAMKYVQYIMPVMFLAFFNNYASGLTCYMFFSNLINIIQTIVTKKYIFDETKIREELLKEKGKPKKKSGFAARLEEAMKQQQALQEAKNKKK